MIEEEQGLVYYKNIRAEETRGNLTSGEVIMDPRILGKTPQSYASNFVSNEVIGTLANAVAAGDLEVVTGTAAIAPVTPQSVRLTVGAAPSFAAFGQDDGNGNIIGAGMTGTINYETGAFSVSVSAVAASGDPVTVSYRTNFENSDDIPQIQSYFDSKQIQARVYALKGTLGMLKSYSMQKRFGLVAEDELARDLIAEINAEIGGDMIRGLYGAASSAGSWSRTPGTGVGWFEHDCVCALAA